jgi:hypothetical protein
LHEAASEKQSIFLKPVVGAELYAYIDNAVLSQWHGIENGDNDKLIETEIRPVFFGSAEALSQSIETMFYGASIYKQTLGENGVALRFTRYPGWRSFNDSYVM